MALQLFFSIVLILSGQVALASEGLRPAMIEVASDASFPPPGTSLEIYVDPEVKTRREQGIKGPVDAVLTVAEGVGTGALSYMLWIVLHEGSHALMIEALGGNVTRFDWLPGRRDDGTIIFAATYWEPPAGREFSDAEDVAIDLAPNMTAFVGAAVGAALWAAGELPDNRLGRIPFTAFQIGAALNLGILFTLSSSKASDGMEAMRLLGLDAGEQRWMKAGMFTLSVLSLVPAADGVVHAFTGLTLFPHRGDDGRGRHAIRVLPVAGPTFAALFGQF